MKTIAEFARAKRAAKPIVILTAYDALMAKPDAERLEPALVKGRHAPVGAYRVG